MTKESIDPVLETAQAQPGEFNNPETGTPATILDRRVDVTGVSWETVGWVAIFLLAALVRLIERTTWPLTAEEARVAADALALTTGGSLSNVGLAHPLLTELDALGMFLFGVSDGIPRLVPELAGFGAILLLLPLRHWLGRGAALAAAFLFAISPTLAFASRRLDAGGLLVAMSLLLLVLLLRHLAQPSAGAAVAAGVAGSLLLLTGPLGWIAVPLTAAVAVSMAGGRRIRPRDLSGLALGLLLGTVVLSTVLFTRPNGFADFLGQSLRQLWDNHLVDLGSQWYMLPFELIIDELLVLLVGIYATWVIWLEPERLPLGTTRPARSLIGWTVAGVIIAALLGGKDAEVYTLAVLPLTLLAAVGLGALIEEIDWTEVWGGRALAFYLGLFLVFAAIAAVLNTLLAGAGGSIASWLFTLLILLALILIPLVLGTGWIALGLTQRVAPLVGLAVVVCLAALALHTSILLPATNIDRPGEPLTVGSTTTDVKVLTGELERLSADVTTFDQDVRDPTGGHGLTIIVDQSIAQPFAWYFREFPNLRVVPGSGPLPPSEVAPEVVITLAKDSPNLVPQKQNYSQHVYALETTSPPAYSSVDWGKLLGSIVNPSQLRHFGAFMIDRQTTLSNQPQMFQLALRQDIAQRMYGTGTETNP